MTNELTGEIAANLRAELNMKLLYALQLWGYGPMKTPKKGRSEVVAGTLEETFFIGDDPILWVSDIKWKEEGDNVIVYQEYIVYEPGQ